MREPRPSLAYRLAWLFAPVGLVLFALLHEGRRIFDFSDPWNVVGGLAAFFYFAAYAWRLTKDALNRRAVE